MEDKIAIVTDSTSDLPIEFCDKNNVFLIPLKVVYGDKEYRDRIDITPKEVYDKLDQEVPTTSTPSFGEVMDLYKSIIEKGYNKIISIHLSNGLSGTYGTINNVANEINKEHTDVEVSVVDGLSISYGTGMLVQSAVAFLKRSMAFNVIVDRLNNVKHELKVFFVLDTLEYLRRGGRIGYVSAVMGSILDLKPVIGVNDEGKYYTHAKVRGRRKSIDKLIAIVKEIAVMAPCKLAVLQGGCEKEALYVEQELRKDFNDSYVYSGAVGPVIGVHTGPGTLGITLCPSWDI